MSTLPIPVGRAALVACTALFVTTATGVVRAEGDKRQQAEQLLDELKAHTASAEVTRMVGRANEALQRAEDKTLPAAAATASNGAALQWARAAAEWVKLQRLEKEADEREHALNELRAKVKHARAQLEETEARRSRAAGLLQGKHDQDRHGTASSGAAPAESGAPATPSATAEPAGAAPAKQPAKRPAKPEGNK